MWWDKLLRVIQGEREGVARNAKTNAGGSRKEDEANKRLVKIDVDIEHDGSDDEVCN